MYCEVKARFIVSCCNKTLFAKCSNKSNNILENAAQVSVSYIYFVYVEINGSYVSTFRFV